MAEFACLRGFSAGRKYGKPNNTSNAVRDAANPPIVLRTVSPDLRCGDRLLVEQCFPAESQRPRSARRRAFRSAMLMIHVANGESRRNVVRPRYAPSATTWHRQSAAPRVVPRHYICSRAQRRKSHSSAPCNLWNSGFLPTRVSACSVGVDESPLGFDGYARAIRLAYRRFEGSVTRWDFAQVGERVRQGWRVGLLLWRTWSKTGQ